MTKSHMPEICVAEKIKRVNNFLKFSCNKDHLVVRSSQLSSPLPDPAGYNHLEVRQYNNLEL